MDACYRTTLCSEKRKHQYRYGKILLMTDQDTDGSHIKGLIINFFRHFWPELLVPSTDEKDSISSDNNNNSMKSSTSFLSYFVTPLLKATPKMKEKGNSWLYSGDKLMIMTISTKTDLHFCQSQRILYQLSKKKETLSFIPC